MIGRVSPRRRVTFLWRRESHKAPPPQRRLAHALAHPRPAGRVETRPGGLRHRRDNSRRPRAALGAAEGKALPARLRHCRRVVVPSFRAWRSGRFVAPAQAGPGLFDLCRSVLRCFRLAVIGRVSPRRASDFLVATRKSPKKRPCRSAGLRRCPRPPASAGRVETRPGGPQTSTRQFRRPRAHFGAAEGKHLPARLRHCRRAVVPDRLGTASGHDSSPGAGRGPGS